MKFVFLQSWWFSDGCFISEKAHSPQCLLLPASHDPQGGRDMPSSMLSYGYGDICSSSESVTAGLVLLWSLFWALIVSALVSKDVCFIQHLNLPIFYLSQLIFSVNLTRLSGSQSNVKHYSGCFCESVLDEFNTETDEVSRIDFPSKCGWVSFCQLSSWSKQKADLPPHKREFLPDCLPTERSVFFCF